MRDSRWQAASSDTDFDPYLAGMPQSSVELFRRFIDLVRACGPVTFELQPRRIVLCGTRRIFASVQITKTGLRGHLNLAHRLTDRRIGTVEPLTRRLDLHRYAITSTAELDEDFTSWLCQARMIGDGEYPD
jgi:Domain of unknown function (DUF5655)